VYSASTPPASMVAAERSQTCIKVRYSVQAQVPPDQGGKLITGRTRNGVHRNKIRKPRRQLKSTRSTQPHQPLKSERHQVDSYPVAP
jgi:hypothetical protein